MKAIKSGLKWIMNFFKDLWEFAESLISGLALAFKYVFIIIDLAIETILQLPPWIQAFGIITITICGVYFVIGREAGKSE